MFGRPIASKAWETNDDKFTKIEQSFLYAILWEFDEQTQKGETEKIEGLLDIDASQAQD